MPTRPTNGRKSSANAGAKRSHRGCASDIIRMKKANPGTSNTVIARAAGCTEGNVRYVLRRFLGEHSDADLQQFQEDKANIVDALQMRVVESITTKKLAKSSAAQLTTMFGILYDKGALLRGQPTGINVTALLDVVEAIKARQQ